MKNITQDRDSLIFRIYGASPNIKIVDFLLCFPKNEFSTSEILEELGMSKTTFYKYFEDLLKFEMVKLNPETTKPKLYSINLDNFIIQNMRKNIDFVSENIADVESMKLDINPIKIKNIELQGIEEQINYLKKRQRQAKVEIRHLEPLEA